MPPLPNQARRRFSGPDLGESMAISHELSSDIATAILSVQKRTPSELNALKKIVLEVHLTLQRMTEEARAARRKQRSASEASSNDH
jgi:hypothetical protein